MGSPAHAVAPSIADAHTDEALCRSADGVEQPDSYGLLYPAGSDADLRFRLMRRLVVSARRWRGHIDQKLRRIGQTQSRWETLLCIAMHPGTTQGELARLISVEDSTVARMLSGLEQDGEIQRLVSPEDRRQRSVAVTPQGEKSLAALQLIVDMLRDNVLQDLDRTELEVGLRILNKLLARLETP
ncbi:MAG: MarR family transcriptional regulator [Sphingomonas bacterium]|nr:MarR family transcriptional regulator [Sphingomonas bacterium]MDB5688715.1 MarR family transcriptional regulator [Sphingomonas bacterium]